MKTAWSEVRCVADLVMPGSAVTVMPGSTVALYGGRPCVAFLVVHALDCRRDFLADRLVPLRREMA